MQFLGEEDNSIPPREKCTVTANVSSNVNGANCPQGKKTTNLNPHQKGKPFCISMKQEMMGWQWHQLDHMQIIFTLFWTDNHASTSSLNFLQGGCSS